MHRKSARAVGDRRGIRTLVVFATFLGVGPVDLSHATGVPWGYAGVIGPDNWGKIFTACGMGRNQAPIDIVEERTLDVGALVNEAETVGSRPAGYLSMQPRYNDSSLRIINNGHSVEVRYDLGSTVSVHGRSSELKQFHFHSPSENRIDGREFPMEVHLVHADEANNLTVIAIMIEEGAENPLIAKLWAHMPKDVGKEVAAEPEKINVTDLLPENKRYYYFNGSLTTPPCSEGVAWLVLKQPVQASKEQLDLFRSTVGFANNRPVQALNTRVILTW